MKLPDLWLSAPAVRLPELVRTNEDVIALVRARFMGDEEAWAPVGRRIRSLLRACGTDKRRFEPEPFPLGGKAAAAAMDVLAAEGRSAADLDLVIYASLAREYFEPATAAEVAARLGADRAMALDVTAACAGAMLGVQDVVARAAVDESIRTALVATATMTPQGFVSYDIQDADQVAMLGAGLTLGNAATAMLISRDRPRSGGRIVAMLAEGMSAHHALCRAPVHGHFVSDGPAIFALARYMPEHLKKVCERAGWTPGEVDFFITHQPSNSVLRAVCAALEIDNKKNPALHSLYGNCAESSAPIALRHTLDHQGIPPGSKVVMAAAASGYVMASLALVWE